MRLLVLLVVPAFAGRIGGAGLPEKPAVGPAVPALGPAAVRSAAAQPPAARAPQPQAPLTYDQLWKAAAQGEPAKLAEATAQAADGSRYEPPAEVIADPEPSGLRALGAALVGLVKKKEAPRIAPFTRAQANPRHPIPETSVLFTRVETYTYDKEIAKALGREGFSSFLRLDDDYIEVRADDIREAATLAQALAKLELVRGVFVSPRVLALMKESSAP